MVVLKDVLPIALMALRGEGGVRVPARLVPLTPLVLITRFDD